MSVANTLGGKVAPSCTERTRSVYDKSASSYSYFVRERRRLGTFVTLTLAAAVVVSSFRLKMTRPAAGRRAAPPVIWIEVNAAPRRSSLK